MLKSKALRYGYKVMCNFSGKFAKVCDHRNSLCAITKQKQKDVHINKLYLGSLKLR